MCNRKENTWWEPRGQIRTECQESQSSVGHAADQRGLWRAWKGVKELAPTGSWKKKSSLSQYMSLHLSLKQQLTVGPFMNKRRNIFLFIKIYFFFYFCFLCSSMFVNHVRLCFRLYLYCGYTAAVQMLKSSKHVRLFLFLSKLRLYKTLTLFLFLVTWFFSAI